MNDIPPLRWSTLRRNHPLLLRLFPAIWALLVLIGVGVYLLVTNALSQDDDVQQRSRTFIAHSLEQQRGEIGRNIINYSKWGEAYRHLHLTVDKAWADDQRNVGDIPFDLYGYNGVWVVDGAGRTVYGVIDGQPSASALTDWLQGDVDGLVAQARAPALADGSVVRAMEVAGAPAIVAAASITPGWDSSIAVVPGPPSVMMFVTVLRPDRLAQLSANYGLPPLTASRQPLPGYESMPLLESATQLNWQPPRPGRGLLRQTLPLFVASVLLLAGVLYLLLRHVLATGRQIEAQMQALRTSQAELQGSERRFRDMAETSSDWLWEVDAQGRLTYLSDRFAQVTGQRRSDWLGRPLADLLRPREGALQPWLQHALSGMEGSATLVCETRGPAGQQRICRITARAIEGGRGHRGTATDLTDEWQAQAEVRHLSLHDALTGLPNRRQLDQFLSQHLAPAAGAPQPGLALLSLDLDRFKPVNDALGHAVGDQVLQEAARRLAALAGPGGMAARVGGDEFILALPQAAGAATAPLDLDALCARVIAALCEPFCLEGQVVFIGTSVGVSLAPAHARTPDELLRRGDIALYEAKAAGRNTWRLYTDAMNAHVLARRQIEGELRTALADGQLRLHYQPRYALPGGALRGLEALVRWQHPERGLLLPQEFIPLAEETGLIRPLGEWVLHTACQEAARWPAAVSVSVNLSPGQLGGDGPGAGDRALPRVVAQALEASGLAPGRLELEITERVLLDHEQGVLQTLTALKQLGVRLSLDDFGTGFSSLAYLRQYPLDGIKIDRSFVAQLPSQGSDRAIVQAMSQLGRSLGLTVTAEGVETQGQLDCLLQQHCDEVQGLHFSAPLPPEGVAALWTAAGVAGDSVRPQR